MKIAKGQPPTRLGTSRVVAGVFPVADTFPSCFRSQIMRSVRSSGTGAENKCEALLRSLKIPFRCDNKHLPGRPDFIVVVPGWRCSWMVVFGTAMTDVNKPRCQPQIFTIGMGKSTRTEGETSESAKLSGNWVQLNGEGVKLRQLTL